MHLHKQFHFILRQSTRNFSEVFRAAFACLLKHSLRESLKLNIQLFLLLYNMISRSSTKLVGRKHIRRKAFLFLPFKTISYITVIYTNKWHVVYVYFYVLQILIERKVYKMPQGFKINFKYFPSFLQYLKTSFFSFSLHFFIQFKYFKCICLTTTTREKKQVYLFCSSYYFLFFWNL